MQRALIKYEQKIFPHVTSNGRLAYGESLNSGVHKDYVCRNLYPENTSAAGAASGKAHIEIGTEIVDCTYYVEAAYIDLNILGFYYRLQRVAFMGKESAALSVSEIRAEIPGRIVKLYAVVGTVVDAGAPLLVHEAMKMEMSINAPRRLRVAEVFVAEGGQVEANQRLMRFEEV